MTTILHKRGTGKPSADDLSVGEIALDTSAGTAYTKLSNGTIVEIGGSGGGIEEAPVDGTQYARQDAAWSPVEGVGSGGGQILHGDVWIGADVDLDLDSAPISQETLYLIMPLLWEKNSRPFTNVKGIIALSSGRWCVVYSSADNNLHYFNYSDDGETWTPFSLHNLWGFGTANPPEALAANGNVVCVIGNKVSAVSTDGGETWTNSDGSNPIGNGQRIHMTWGAGKFHAVQEGYPRLVTSPDGITWTEIKEFNQLFGNTASDFVYAIEWNGEYFIAAGSKGRYATSTDGANWTMLTGISDIHGDACTIAGVKWIGDRWIAVGVETSSGNKNVCLTSRDGISWSDHSEAFRDGWNPGGGNTLATGIPATIVWNGHRIFIPKNVGSSDATGGFSIDGTSWTTHTQYGDPMGAESAVSGAFNGKKMAVVGGTTLVTDFTQNVITAEESLGLRLVNRLKNIKSPVTQDTKDFNDEELGDE